MDRVTASSPVRTADLGGWTDTWFAAHGSVFNIAINPGVTVTLTRTVELGPGRVHISALGQDRIELVGQPWHDRLHEALLAPLGGGWKVKITSGVPAGSGLGTSASVGVAICAAIAVLEGSSPDHLDREALAHKAHQIETGIGLQSGIQDHAAAALGGARLWRIDYPNFACEAALLDYEGAALASRLLTVYLGSPHASSELHELVIAELERKHQIGESGTDDAPELGEMRGCAVASFQAAKSGDWADYGKSMVRNHEAIRSLQSGLVSTQADDVVSTAILHGALGWKVNGAGGTGGTVAIFCPAEERAAKALRSAIKQIEGIDVLQTDFCAGGVEVEV